MTNTIDIPVAEEKAKNQPRRIGAGTIILLVSMLIAGVIIAVQLYNQQKTQPVQGNQAPGFDFTTFDGESYTLSDFRGKVVVLNFWASWCAPCREEAPELEAAWQRYADSGDVVFLGIAYADNGPRSIAYLEEFEISYLNAPDLGTRISDLYRIQGVPETFIIDQNGIVAQFIYAGVNEEQLVNIIEPLLAGG